MPAKFMPADFISSASAARTSDSRSDEMSDDLARPRQALLLMRELEGSLDASRKALLALDLNGIERGTREQVGLIRKLEAVLHSSGRPRVQEKQREGQAFDSSASACELEAERTQCQSRILQATRLQAALLARARYKLRVLANMLAGCSINYGPLLVFERDIAPPPRTVAGLSKSQEYLAEGADPCRA
jgi:hypothetical protein